MTCMSEHNELIGYIDRVSTISDYVSIYSKYAKERGFDFDIKEYNILNDLVNNNLTKEVKEIIILKLGDFFEYDKRQYLLGKHLKKEYVKFSFSEDKREEYPKIGDRKYYMYKENTIAEDYFEGCGFSFGEISKAFFYFQNGNYGERLMFVSPLKDEVYYQRKYEYFGKKIKITKISDMSEIDILEYILKNMSHNEKTMFFGNQESFCFSETFGSVQLTINRMKEYDDGRNDKRYEKAIAYLMEQKKYFEKD